MIEINAVEKGYRLLSGILFWFYLLSYFLHTDILAEDPVAASLRPFSKRLWYLKYIRSDEKKPALMRHEGEQIRAMFGLVFVFIQIEKLVVLCIYGSLLRAELSV